MADTDIVKRFLRRDRDCFTNNKIEIQRQNIRVLRSACILYLLILTLFTTRTLLSGESLLLARMYFVFDAIHLLLCFLILRRPWRKDASLRYMNCCRILFELSLLLFFLLEAVFPFPDRTSLYFPFPIVLLVMLFSYPVKNAIALILAYVVSFAALVLRYKTPAVQPLDLAIAMGALISALAGYFIVASLRHETSAAIARLQSLSMIDVLTGLYNKDTFESLCRAFLASGDGRGYALLFIDLDLFKFINDHFGHQTGDAVLAGVGAILRDTFYEKDYLCRFGGDEFVVFMADVKNRADVGERVNVLQERLLALARSLRIEALSCSVGIAMKTAQSETFSELLSRADAALYVAKKSGRHQLSFAEAAGKPAALPDAVAEAAADETRTLLRRVLVVDDNAVNRQILRNILSFSYEVLEAANGREALDLLGNIAGTVSAVLLDLAMPVMDGYEMLTRIRADERLAGLPVIVSTGNATEESELRALSLGANDYVVKPYRPDIIIHRLENLIALRERAAQDRC